MSFPLGIFNQVLAMNAILPKDKVVEIRLENDANGNPLYTGYTPTPNAATDQAVWFLVKATIDGNDFPERYQLPDDGLGFKYTWDDRATYFT